MSALNLFFRTCRDPATADGRSPPGGRRDSQWSAGCCYDQSVLNAPLAQLAEQRTLNPRVRGSSPWRRTRKSPGQSHSRRWLWCARDRPGSNASSNRGHSLVLVVPQGAGHPIGRLPQDLRRDVAIGVHRERDLAVPEDLRHLAGRNVLSQQQAGRRVTEIMEPDRWQTMPWRPACRTPGKTPSGGRSTRSTARSW
jgi:hypothetical protein